MRMFSPFGNEQGKAARAEPGSADTAGDGAAAGAEDPAALDHLKRQVDLLRKQFDALTKDGKG